MTTWRDSKRFSLVIGFLLIGAALFFVAHQLPVNRSQEARVVVTAEEMANQPLGDWLIPTMNGEVRLKKPPLAYWFSAASIKIFGPTDLAARVPAVLAAWATIGLTYLIALRLFNPRVALFAGLTLLGSRLFFKQAALAETDTLVTAFMTGAFWCALQIADMRNQSRVTRERGFLALLATLIACTIMVKGPQALLVLLALIGFDLVRHRLNERSFRRGITVRLFTTGSFLITALLALPWFVYVMTRAESNQLVGDLANSAGGGLGHSRGFFAYFAMLPAAMLPWSIVWITAMWIAFLTLRRPQAPDSTFNSPSEKRSLSMLFAWGTALFVPLLFWGNKQIHYLLPLMPVVMILVGWMLDRALRDRTDPASRVVKANVILLLIVAALLVPALPILGRHFRSHDATIDYILASAIAIAIIACLARARHGSAGTLTRIAAVLSAIIVYALSAWWAPSLDPVNSYTITMRLREQFPNAHFVFRDEPSLAMVAAFDRAIPVKNEEQLALLSTDPKERERVICLDVTEPFDVAPTNFEELERIIDDDDTVVVYAVEGSALDVP